MWPFLSNDLFPPPTEAWLQKVSSDPEAQGWGAWGRIEKTPLGPGSGTESDEEDEDAGFLLAMLKQENLPKSPVYSQAAPCHDAGKQELEAIRLKLWAMEHAAALPEPPYALRKATEEEGAEVRQLLSPETMGCCFPGTSKEKVEADHRSVYVGNVDYGGSAAELEAYFSHCGKIHRVTILCDKFSGHPKGYAYIEFASQSAVQAAVELDESTFRGRIIKVLPKRTNFPGISSTDRGGLRTHSGSRAQPLLHSSLHRRPRFRLHGPSRLLCATIPATDDGLYSRLLWPEYWGRGRVSPWFSPY